MIERWEQDKMRIKVNRADLLDKIYVVGRALQGKSRIPSLDGIYISKQGDDLILCANNLEMAIKTVEKNINGEGEFAAVLPKNFMQVVRQLPDVDVEIAVQDNKAEIISGRSKFSLNCLSDADEFPLFNEDYKDNPVVALSGSVLKNLVRKTVFCVSSGIYRVPFNGVLINNDGGSLVCMSSDTYRLARYEVQANIPRTFKIIIPGKFLSEVGKIVKDEDFVKLYIGESNVVFVAGNYEVSIILLDGEYPDCEGVFPRKTQTKIKVKKLMFANMLNRANLLTPEGNKVLALSVNDKLRVEAANETGRMNEEIPVVTEGKPLEKILLNAQFLGDIVKVVDNEELSIEFNGAFGPAVIKDENFRYLVLPIKTREVI